MRRSLGAPFMNSPDMLRQELVQFVPGSGTEEA